MDQTNTNKYNKQEVHSSHDPNKGLRLLTNKLTNNKQAEKMSTSIGSSRPIKASPTFR